MATTLPTSPDGMGIASLDVRALEGERAWHVGFAVPGDLTGPDGILQGGLAAGLTGAAVLATGASTTDPMTGLDASITASDLTTVHARLKRPTPVGALLHATVVQESPTDFHVEVRNGDEVTVVGDVEVAGPPPVPHVPDLLDLGRAPIPPAVEQTAYAHCWVCGASTVRGLHIAPHPVLGLGRDLNPWTPDQRVDDGSGRVHWLAAAAVLDCPGVWAGFSQLGHPLFGTEGDPDRRVALLAEHRVQVFAHPELGTDCRSVALVDAIDDRALRVRSAILDQQGRMAAMASSLHILVAGMPDAPVAATPLDGRVSSD